MTTDPDQQPLADDEITLEPARYLDIVNRGVAIEGAGLGDGHGLAVLQIRCGATDDEPIAGRDLARQRGAPPDDQLPCLDLIMPRVNPLIDPLVQQCGSAPERRGGTPLISRRPPRDPRARDRRSTGAASTKPANHRISLSEPRTQPREQLRCHVEPWRRGPLFGPRNCEHPACLRVSDPAR